MNRSGRGEAIPLLETSEMREEREIEEGTPAEDKIIFAESKKRGTSLIFNDAILLVLEYIQIYALLHAMSLRWPWPEGWIKSMNFIFFVNVDIWEFMKVHTNGTYKNVQSHYTESDTVPVNYWFILLAWGIVMFLLIGIFVIIYIILLCKRNPMLLIHISRMQRVYVIIFQVLALPFCIACARVFHCNGDGFVDVDNSLQCFGSTHWAYISPALAAFLVYLIAFPYWLIKKTNAEVLMDNSDSHEGYLQLKETEYVQGLDNTYEINNFHIFSSFKRKGVHMRAAVHVLKLVQVVWYAALFQHILAMAALVNVFLIAMLLTFIIMRPFRVGCFNIILGITYLCLMANSLLGTMLTSFDAFSVRSPWLTPTYMTYMLIAINVVWLISVIVFIIYLVVRHFGGCRKYLQPLWPSITTHGLNKLTPETRKFMRAILKAKQIMERAVLAPPLFAPAHELARQIQVINAYTREAEMLDDQVHTTLLDTLDELIEIHSQVSPRSLFAESVKDSIRDTAEALMEIMPMFVRRLAQREYDFILVNPVKRRLLLKMYCLGLFLNGRSERIKKQKLMNTGTAQLWHEKEEDESPDDGYFDDLYPGHFNNRNQTYSPSLNLTEMDMTEMDGPRLTDSQAVDMWDQPGTSQDVAEFLAVDMDSNQAGSSLYNDTDSLALSEMMHGVPSLSHHSHSTPSSVSHQSSQRSVRPGSSVSRHNPRPASAMSLTPIRPGSPARPGSGVSRTLNMAHVPHKQIEEANVNEEKKPVNKDPAVVEEVSPSNKSNAEPDKKSNKLEEVKDEVADKPKVSVDEPK
ncbi:unnamed protein product, partial [Owenia fusiformis]